MSTTLIYGDDKTVDGPTGTDLAAALDGLLSGEDSQADLWLENDDGWALSVAPTGDLFFENLDEDSDRYQTMGPLERDEILRLLQLMADGNLDALRAEAWEVGE